MWAPAFKLAQQDKYEEALRQEYETQMKTKSETISRAGRVKVGQLLNSYALFSSSLSL
jgi:hypothetical protein